MKQISELIPPIEGESLIEDSGFEAFWSVYPRKTDKKTALRSWEKLNEKDRLAACAGASYHAENNPQWRDKALIPHASTFLNGRRWEDEIVIPRREEINGDLSDVNKMVWSGMNQLYGKSWIDKHGDRPSAIWRNQLANLSAEDIKQGFRFLVDTGEKNAPSMPYFVSICKKKNDLQEFKGLPKPTGSDAVAFEAIAEMKRILRR